MYSIIISHTKKRFQQRTQNDIIATLNSLSLSLLMRVALDNGAAITYSSGFIKRGRGELRTKQQIKMTARL